MAFAFKQVTISGANLGVEGTSKAINEITNFLVNDVGFSITDDRRAQAGNSSLASTHKVVLVSNGGESALHPNWYLTLASGTAATVGTDSIDFFIATAYDTGTHAVPASGVSVISGSRGIATLDTDSDGYFSLWMSGDKDTLVFVSNARDTWSSLIVGRGNNFFNDATEPYGLYLVSPATTTNPTSTAVRWIAGNPPGHSDSGSGGTFQLYTAPTVSNEPRINLNPEIIEPVFTALPILFTVNATSPARKGAISYVKNAWGMAGNTVGVVRPLLLTVSGSSSTYLAFGATSYSLVIRRT